MQWIISFSGVLARTMLDVAPIVVIILGFQWLVIRQPIPNLKKAAVGLIYVVLGMALFLEGLQQALFPLGKLMAAQLTDPVFILGDVAGNMSKIGWQDYIWVYIFAGAIGFSTTIAEPALIAVGLKAEQVSGGTITTWELRIAVAIGVAFGVALGTYRIIAGIPIYYFITTGYLVVLVQTLFAPRVIIPLAYDSGGVTTSTVTVPLVAALGLGLAGTVPGRSPLLDGFGLIAFASLFPIITVLGYAQLSELRARRR